MFGLFALSFLLVGLVGTVLWIVALIDCLTNEPSEGNDKIIWLLVIIFAHGVGSLIYLIVRRPQRIAQHGR